MAFLFPSEETSQAFSLSKRIWYKNIFVGSKTGANSTSAFKLFQRGGVHVVHLYTESLANVCIACVDLLTHFSIRPLSVMAFTLVYGTSFNLPSLT